MSRFNAAFKKWFGKSIVVKGDGSPQVVYHGTPNEFSAFSSRDGDHLGHHFGSRDQAEERLRREKHSGRIIAVYLSIQNPLKTLDAGDWSNSYRVWEIVNKTTRGALGEYDFKLNNMPKRKRMTILTRMIQELGYDGIVYRNAIEGRGESFIALSPSQIKSVDNDGTWDKDDPKIASNPPMLDSHKGERWFHATPSDEFGKSILASGTINASVPKGKGLMAPRSGFTYMSKSLQTAAIYALNGVMMGHEYPEAHWRGAGRYGWIFEVDTSGPIDVEPDEDEVGYLVAEEPATVPWLYSMAVRMASSDRLKRARNGEVAYQAAIGKQLLKRLTPGQKLKVMEYSKNLAVSGNTKFIHAWRLDKSRAPEIKTDGSNVLEIAEKLL